MKKSFIHTASILLSLFIGTITHSVGTFAAANTHNNTPKLVANTLTNVSSEHWTTVTLPHTYSTMVVVATPLYGSFSPPMIIRIKDATGDQFKIKMELAAYQGVPREFIADVNYLVVEAGVYNESEHGIKMEAVLVNSTSTAKKGDWLNQSQHRYYTNHYNKPVVVGQVMTNNDVFSIFWSTSGRSAIPNKSGGMRSIMLPANATDILVGKHIGTYYTSFHRLNESIGYVVFESGVGVVSDLPYHAALGKQRIRGMDNRHRKYIYPGSHEPKAAIATIAGMRGGEGGWAVLTREPTASNIYLAIDEDLFTDTHRRHIKEHVSYILFEDNSPSISSVIVEGPIKTDSGNELLRMEFSFPPNLRPYRQNSNITTYKVTPEDGQLTVYYNDQKIDFDEYDINIHHESGYLYVKEHHQNQGFVVEIPMINPHDNSPVSLLDIPSLDFSLSQGDINYYNSITKHSISTVTDKLCVNMKCINFQE